jgi:ATP-dependent protease ClpP protease subunit
MPRKMIPLPPEIPGDLRWDAPRAAKAVWNRASLRGAQARESAADFEINVFDVIGQTLDGEGITASSIRAQLAVAGERPLTVNVNSPGGSFFDGLAIYNLLAAHPAPVTVRVLGLAASAASIIAMAGDRIEMGAASQMMIHDTMAVAIGNASVMLETASVLEMFDEAAAMLYYERAKKGSAEHFRALMAAETWMDADRAIAEGLADSKAAPRRASDAVATAQVLALISSLEACE